MDHRPQNNGKAHMELVSWWVVESMRGPPC